VGVGLWAVGGWAVRVRSARGKHTHAHSETESGDTGGPTGGIASHPPFFPLTPSPPKAQFEVYIVLQLEPYHSSKII